MNRILPLSAIILVATIGAACTSASAGAGSQPPAPSQPPVATPLPSAPVPSAPPVSTPKPTAKPTAKPTPKPSDGPIRVTLESAAADHVTIDILDESGRIVRAESGHPGEGASVPTGKLQAENVDARTLRLTWTDIPGDNKLGLYVNETASVMLVIQPDHDGDAMALDRVLIVEFDRPVSADDFLLGVQEGLDTAG
jgi:hypothetical protein